jgi:hypothetical protein
MTYQTGAAANALTVGSYAYDGFARLVQRTVSNVAGASGTTNYYYDEFGHVVLETDGSGNSLREYIWLGDMPVAIIDDVDTTAPVLYYVHADHLNRPILVNVVRSPLIAARLPSDIPPSAHPASVSAPDRACTPPPQENRPAVRAYSRQAAAR